MLINIVFEPQLAPFFTYFYIGKIQIYLEATKKANALAQGRAEDSGSSWSSWNRYASTEEWNEALATLAWNSETKSD
jgi:hypothetical protein